MWGGRQGLQLPSPGPSSKPNWEEAGTGVNVDREATGTRQGRAESLIDDQKWEQQWQKRVLIARDEIVALVDHFCPACPSFLGQFPWWA